MWCCWPHVAAEFSAISWKSENLPTLWDSSFWRLVRLNEETPKWFQVEFSMMIITSPFPTPQVTFCIFIWNETKSPWRPLNVESSYGTALPTRSHEVRWRVLLHPLSRLFHKYLKIAYGVSGRVVWSFSLYFCEVDVHSLSVWGRVTLRVASPLLGWRWPELFFHSQL